MGVGMKFIERNLSTLVKEVDRRILPFVESIDDEKISKYNEAWNAKGADKFRYFVELQKNRFLKALDIIMKTQESGTVCDLGCFVPYLPVALAILGYRVKIVDRYEFYGESLRNSIQKLADANSIEVYSLDIVNDNFDRLAQNDLVMLMAVVEHLNGTPRHLMEKIQQIISPGGFLLFEVPNIAEVLKRIRFLMGFSPLQDYKQYFDSDYPFTGHNREMTMQEVLYLLKNSGFSVEYMDCYDYDTLSIRTWQGKLAHYLKRFLPLKDKGQSIIVKARPVRTFARTTAYAAPS